MARKGGLGKGLDALLQDPTQPAPAAAPPGDSGVIEAPISKVIPNPQQPRQIMKAEQLQELADSIIEHGVIQPLIVTYDKTLDQYILIAGERRLRAAALAGLKTVPVLVREATNQQQLELALIENVQRADLTALETAEAYEHLQNEFSLSHEEIGSRVGKSRTAVTNTLRLLKLPPVVKQALADDQITEGHARALLALSTTQRQTAALQTIIKQGLNVRQTEELVRKLSGEKPAPKPRQAPSPEILELEQQLRTHFGTKVTLSHGKNGGSVIIHYYSNEELDALMGRLLEED
ncbi:MAG: ParB/RepB/Spo0J family partition protein [Anaerolineaceae bacterium]|jgi:ParB family chromosome partitioning protein|nr:ParB/RepB/Spo0J family partition protein [Anaerolineaceae bacterium]